MRFTRIYLLLVCSVLIPACAIPGDSPWSDLHANAYAVGFSPTFEASSSGIVIDGDGANPELSGSFAINSEEEFTNLYGASIGFAPFELSVSQFSYSRNQVGVFGGDGGSFGGVLLNDSIPISSTLDIDATKIMVGIDVLNTSIARVGLLAGFDVLSFNHLSFQQQDTGINQNVFDNQEVPVPIIGLRGDIAIPDTSISLGAEISGISIDVDSAEASLFDHYINLSLEIFKNAEAVVGYRTMSIKIDGSVAGTQIQNMDLSMSGPYFGVSVYF
jgi:hypothetical protein